MTYRLTFFAVPAFALSTTTATAHLGDTAAALASLKPAAMTLAQPLLQPADFQVAQGEICVFEPIQTADVFDIVGGQSMQPKVLACLGE